MIDINWIAVDIDDTLAQTSRMVLQRLLVDQATADQETAYEQVEEALQMFKIPQSVPALKEQVAQDRIRVLLESDEFMVSVPAFSGAVEAIQDLTTICSVPLLYITSRLEEQLPSTNTWLRMQGFVQGTLVYRHDSQRAEDWKYQELVRRFNAKPGILLEDSIVRNGMQSVYKNIIVFLADLYGYYAKHTSLTTGSTQIIPFMQWNHLFPMIQSKYATWS